MTMSLRFYTLDLKGNPQEAQTIEEWIHWATYHTHDRIVLKTKVDTTWIVTIFLLYETMVFGGIRPGFSRKFPNRTQAVDFHHDLENMVRESVDEWDHHCDLERGPV